MIERYTRPEMGALWQNDLRFGFMMQVEIAVAQVQAAMGIIPRKAAKAIASKSKVSAQRIAEIEKETKHDVIAFVSNMAENVGEHGRYVHFGLTSSDVLDTALALQMREAGKILMQSFDFCQNSLSRLVQKHKTTLCAGRTHGMFAEPITFGLKMAGFLAEMKRNRKRLEHSLRGLEICKLSGAVGTYSSQGPLLEKRVAERLRLQIETVATQVVPRDRHAELFTSLALHMSGLERLAIELRHLQRSEVGEVTEGFSKGQKGSSAMPHKKNPISAENITGLARMVRSYAIAALENVALWHERDISHSSVERVFLPDVFILSDYATYRMGVLLDGLQVHGDRMKKNIDLSQGQLFSSQLLLTLVEKGFSREEAYMHVQRLCHSLGVGDHLQTRISEDQELGPLFKKAELKSIFSGERNRKHIETVLRRALK